MPYETVILEKLDRIAKITLNRPGAMNAINRKLRAELHAAVEEVEADSGVDVLILTGAGRAFCAGRDLKELPDDIDVVGRYPSMYDKVRGLEIPTIGAINGFAITGGFELAINCDILIASENAKFADTHARVGIFPGAGMSQILPRLVGVKKAKELSFTGNFIDAQEALRVGLVNKVVPAAELDAAAMTLARDILSCDQEQVRKMKRVIDQGIELDLKTAMQIERLESIMHKAKVSSEDLARRRGDVIARGRAQA